MKHRVLIGFAFLNFLLSSTILQLFRINGALPNLCIIFSIVILAHQGKEKAMTFALTCGLLQDLFLGRLLGVNVIAYLAVVLFADRMIRVLFKGNYLTPLFLIATSTAIYHVVFYVIMFFFQITIPFSLLGERIATEIILNALIGIVMYAKVFKWTNGYKLGDFNA